MNAKQLADKYNGRLSLLQIKILSYLAEHPVKNITEVAMSIGVFRSSVSRSIKLLQSKGMMSQDWQITDIGIQEILSTFRLANDISWKWGDLMFGYNCPCGEEIILSNESLEECECGRIYHFTNIIEVKGYSK